MNSNNTNEETRLERAEEEKALDASVDHERLARLVVEAKHSPVRSAAQHDFSASASAQPATRKFSARAIVIAIVIVSAVVLLLLSSSMFVSRFESPSLISRPTKDTATTNNAHTNEPSNIKPAMVAIPGGTFQMGRDDGLARESPAHSVTVRDFLMDNTEVTNAEYAEFVRDTNHVLPENWVGPEPPYGTKQWPVVNVSLDDVAAFAAWRSKRDNVSYRLPTEAEWEYAARSGAQYDFPWGKSWEENRAVVKEATPRPVGSYPEGANRWGVVDLIGNVWEWTSSEIQAYPGNPTEIPNRMKEWRVLRGGSFASDPKDTEAPLSAALRTWFAPSGKDPRLGFRLVRTGP